MNRSVFKHGYWAASRGLQSQGATAISILFPAKTLITFLTTSLSFDSAFCNISDVQQGNASFEHIFNPRWGSVVLLGSHIWKGMFLNMATELPPGDCKAKEPQLYPYCFRPKTWSMFLTTSLSFESAFCNIFAVQKGNASFEHIFSPRWGSVVLLRSHLWIGVLLNMATELPPGDCKAKGPQLYPYCFRPKPRSIFLTTSLSFESAFCNISDVQLGNASFEHIFNPRWGSVVLLGSHIWIGMFLNMATELPPEDCKAKEPQLCPYCFRPKPWCICLTKSLSSESAFCNIFDVQKGNASFEHIFNQRWGSVVLLGSHPWLGLLLNMATELPPGGLQSQEVRSHNDIHTVSDHWSHLYQALSLESALCKILDVQKGNASFEHMLNAGWVSAVLLSSHLWLGLLLNMATELPPGGLQSQEVGSHNDIHTVSDHWSHLYQTVSLESALCKILDVQKGNASFEHMFNPRWGSVVLLGSHLWIGVFLNMAIGRCKVFLHSYVYW